MITAQFIRYIHEVEALDSWQRRVLGWDKDLLWEDIQVKGYRALRRGFLAIAFNGERDWLYFYVSPELPRFMLSFNRHEPVSRSRVDRWLTWKIASRRYHPLKEYKTDYIRRCQSILRQHPESVMSLLSPRVGGFRNILWSYLASDALGA